MPSTLPTTGFPDAADTVTHALTHARSRVPVPAPTLLPTPATGFPHTTGFPEPADTVTHALSLLTRRQPPPPAPAIMFTVTVHLGGSDYGFDTMKDATEVTTDEGAPLRLVFTTSTAATAEEAAAAAMGVGARRLSTSGAGERRRVDFAVDRSHRDDAGQSWPAGTRPLEPGDVLSVTSPHGALTRLSLEPTGIFPLHPA
ncbi:hypothetical protein ACFWGI_36620 [Streptomyces niveus]|uniref:hypothetical protein n=1 Tax=Streptomyces niveus TaxID=193462 RepID=UPI003663B3A0